MGEVGFGQPDDGIIQMAYVVPDLRAAIAHWTGTLRVGPWFVLEHFTGDDPVYRGQPSKAQVALAMSFCGHMNLELIQPKNDAPSVYRELIERRGYGFHHVGIAVSDVEAERAAYERRGYTTVFEAPVPSGGSVVYLEGRHFDPGLIELIPATAGMDEMFTRFWRAAAGWTGQDPIRPFG